MKSPDIFVPRVWCMLTGILLGFSPAPAFPAPAKPNILFVLADDLGINDVSCYGSEIPTPAIDSLARSGAKLEQYYTASPVCTPSRFGFLTGRYPARSRDRLLGALMFAEERDSHRGIRPGELTIAEVLRTNGYQTALIGKWHLGHGEPEFSPLNHGFDYFYGMNGGCVDYYSLQYGNLPDWVRNGKPAKETGYSTDLLTEDAVRYLKSQKREKPFFLYLSYNAPHYGKGWNEQKRQFTNILQAKPDDRDRLRSIENLDRREYAAMVAAMDKGIGRVLETLKSLDLEQNTLVVFTSDNGGDPHYGGNNSPYRGVKNQVFEGGIRVPCIIRWPGVHNEGSRSIRQPVDAIDFFPTFCHVAGISYSQFQLDGTDLSRVILEGKQFDRDLCWTLARAHSYRRGPWKYVHANGTNMLFNIDADPFETNDLAKIRPQELAELRAAYDKIAIGFTPARPTGSKAKQAAKNFDRSGTTK